jgi:tetratricopeptide (TPR) repeat protein
MPSAALLALAIFADLGSSARAHKGLEAAAAASPRPIECAAGSRHRGTELWERARGQRVEIYCGALARGFALLQRAPDAALKEALAAERALPGHAATRILKGRALLRLGELEEAYSLLSGLAGKTPDAFADPGALHDLALVELLSGRLNEALREYRTLVPRTQLLEDVRERHRVLIEAGGLALALGPANSSEALGYLGEARRLGAPPGLGDLTIGLLALALDRSGRVEQARALVREASGPWVTERLTAELRSPSGEAAKKWPLGKVLLPALVGSEAHAIVALLAERTDVKLAKAQWAAFLQSSAGQGPWAEHARKKLAGLGASERRGAS